MITSSEKTLKKKEILGLECPTLLCTYLNLGDNLYPNYDIDTLLSILNIQQL